MTVYLTSFKRYHTSPGGDAFSVAVYQPNWYPALPERESFDIRDQNGNWIRPRDFLPDNHDPTKADLDLIGRYSDTLYDLYESREKEIEKFLHETPENITLCCWCPYDKAAKRQIHDYGTFVCHTAVIEVYLQTLGLTVERDKDREKMVRF